MARANTSNRRQALGDFSEFAQIIRLPLTPTDVETSGTVYIADVLDQNDVGLVKIGYSTRDPRTRIQEIQRRCKILHLRACNGTRICHPRRTEKIVHSILRQWTSLQPTCNQCQQTHGGLKRECFAVNPQVAAKAVQLAYRFMSTRPYDIDGHLRRGFEISLGDIPFTSRNPTDVPERRLEIIESWIANSIEAVYHPEGPATNSGAGNTPRRQWQPTSVSQESLEPTQDNDTFTGLEEPVQSTETTAECNGPTTIDHGSGGNNTTTTADTLAELLEATQNARNAQFTLGVEEQSVDVISILKSSIFRGLRSDDSSSLLGSLLCLWVGYMVLQMLSSLISQAKNAVLVSSMPITLFLLFKLWVTCGGQRRSVSESHLHVAIV